MKLPLPFRIVSGVIISINLLINLPNYSIEYKNKIWDGRDKRNLNLWTKLHKAVNLKILEINKENL